MVCFLGQEIVPGTPYTAVIHYPFLQLVILLHYYKTNSCLLGGLVRDIFFVGIERWIPAWFVVERWISERLTTFKHADIVNRFRILSKALDSSLPFCKRPLSRFVLSRILLLGRLDA